MIAAIYARKSTDQAVTEEEKSVTRQVEHAREYARRKGWDVADEHVYIDDGISGAEFAKRPGFLRLMNVLKPRPPFQVLVMSEESRLGRESIETAYALKQLVTAGVRVFFYLDDRERTLDSPTEKVLLSLTAFADELEREKARQRTYDAMLRKARAGHVTGGRVFGYDNISVAAADGRRSHVERRINEREAEVIRRIFRLCADGHGLTAITKLLNDEHAVSPRAQRGRPTAWAPSSVREVLYRELYRGVIVWNRTRKRNLWGQVQPRDRASGEWLRVPAPALRIVSDEVWTSAHRRLEAARHTYLRGTNGRLWGRPRWGSDSKYLLTGLARCGQCGGGLYVKTRSHGKRRAFFYGCTSFHLRGKAVCANSLEVPMALADAAVLGAFERDVLRPDVVEQAIARAIARLQPSQQMTEAAVMRYRTELEELNTELARLTLAVAGGGELATLVAAIRTREARRAIIHVELETLKRPAVEPEALRANLRVRLDDWRGLLLRHVPQARQILRTLLTSAIVFTPGRSVSRGGRYDFAIEASVAKLIAGADCASSVASLTGTDELCTIRTQGTIDIPKRAA